MSSTLLPISGKTFVFHVWHMILGILSFMRASIKLSMPAVRRTLLTLNMNSIMGSQWPPERGIWYPQHTKKHRCEGWNHSQMAFHGTCVVEKNSLVDMC